jgi:hypothetical protein
VTTGIPLTPGFKGKLVNKTKYDRFKYRRQFSTRKVFFQIQSFFQGGKKLLQKMLEKFKEKCHFLKRLADLKWKTLFGKHQLLVAVQGTSSAQ